MIKQTFLFLLLVISLHGFPQIGFEKGYFINDKDERIECLVKNVDWRNNPKDFEYKVAENDDSRTAGIQSTKEFGIYNFSKYIRAVVKMDRSTEELTMLSKERFPVFTEETLYLKVLVEGKASLYIYEEGNLTRFFFKQDTTDITQLVYKLYSVDGRKIGYNYQFRQQLLTDLNCHSITENNLESLNYSENELARLFIKYNECQNSPFIDYKPKRDFFNLTIRPGMNISSFSMSNSYSDQQDFDFGSQCTFRPGIEAELIFPFNKNKWSIFLEPTYQYFHSERENFDQHAEVDYQSIELPVGLRYYFFLGDKSKIFVNAAFVADFSINSEIYYNAASRFEIDPDNNFAFGMGYKYRNKYSLELRYLTRRTLVTNYVAWASDYTTFSMIFGYSIF